MAIKQYFLLMALGSLLIFSCESEKRIPPRGYIPNTPKATEDLQAAYFWIPQDKLNSPYWKEADYIDLDLEDLSTRNLYGDGLLNATGTYAGVNNFNKGNGASVRLKAGYDDEYIYILAEWKDTTADPSYFTWKYNGPSDPRKSDTTNGWTSQYNQDNFTLLFPVDGQSGQDAWRWSLAYTAPYDFAMNMMLTGSGDLINEGDDVFVRNSEGETDRSGPQYEWNGIRQDINLSDGTKKFVDPSYYLLDEYKMAVTGNVAAGGNVFNVKADCRYCHGPDGNGVADGFTDGGPLNRVFTNKYSREGLEEFIGSSGHEGSGPQYWGQIRNNPADIENMITFLRGIAGVPGHYLTDQSGEPDIKVLSNIQVGGISTVNTEYRLLFKRKLNTGNSADVIFEPDKTYSFSLRASDNDEINYVGASNIQLSFKSNKL